MLHHHAGDEGELNGAGRVGVGARQAFAEDLPGFILGIRQPFADVREPDGLGHAFEDGGPQVALLGAGPPISRSTGSRERCCTTARRTSRA